MCGILAVYSKKNKVDQNKFLYSLKQMNHRGPDNLEIYYSDNEKVSLGHVRLSIVDLSKEGNQPMSNENNNLYLVCNGEIYNYKKLKLELEELGHVFYSNSDSEVILHGYEEWGHNVVDKIEGMFAFIIYNKQKNELFSARDGMGIKPLYYYDNDEYLIIASELSSIKSYSNNLEISDVGISYLLTICHIPAPYTIWKNVKKLYPGNYFIFQNNSLKIKTFWEPSSKLNKNINDTEKEWENIFHKVIDEQLVADVPVGLFLSAGLDSTSIAVAATKIKKNIYPLTLGFNRSPLDELEIASEITKALKLKHLTKTLELEDIDKTLNKVTSYIDEPVLFSSLLVMDSISEYASKHFKTILSGTGGDEVLGGYDWQKSKFELIYINNREIDILSIAYKLIYNLSYKEAFIYSYLKRSSMRFNVEQLHKLFPASKKVFSNKKLVEPYLRYYSPKLPITRKIQKLDLMIFCSGINLSLIDKSSMHNSLEVRVPFLDRNIVNFGIEKPITKQDMQNKNSKNTLRKYLKNNITEEILKMKKRGFRMLNMDKINYENYQKEIMASFFIRNDYWNKDYVIKIFKKKDLAKIYSLVFLTKWARAQNL